MANNNNQARLSRAQMLEELHQLLADIEDRRRRLDQHERTIREEIAALGRLSVIPINPPLGALRSNAELASRLSALDDDEDADPVLDTIRMAIRTRQRYRRESGQNRRSGE